MNKVCHSETISDQSALLVRACEDRLAPVATSTLVFILLFWVIDAGNTPVMAEQHSELSPEFLYWHSSPSMLRLQVPTRYVTVTAQGTVLKGTRKSVRHPTRLPNSVVKKSQSKVGASRTYWPRISRARVGFAFPSYFKSHQDGHRNSSYHLSCFIAS